MPLPDNPFEPLSPQRLARIFRWPPEAVHFLEGEADCLHIVGDAGMGKTALLLQIRQRLAEERAPAPYTCFPPDTPTVVDEVPLGPVTLLDEADRLTPPRLGDLLVRIRAAGYQVALATHRDHQREIERLRLSWLHLELRPLRRPEQVEELLCDRIALAAGTCDHAFVLALGAAKAVLRHSKGNIERCLQLGYEIFEDLVEPRTITAGDVAAAAEALSRALR